MKIKEELQEGVAMCLENHCYIFSYNAELTMANNLLLLLIGIN